MSPELTTNIPRKILLYIPWTTWYTLTCYVSQVCDSCKLGGEDQRMKVINIITEQSCNFSHHIQHAMWCVLRSLGYIHWYKVHTKKLFSLRKVADDISYDANFLIYGIPFCDSGVQLCMCIPQSHMTKGDMIKCNSINST